MPSLGIEGDDLIGNSEPACPGHPAWAGHTADAPQQDFPLQELPVHYPSTSGLLLSLLSQFHR